MIKIFKNVSKINLKKKKKIPLNSQHIADMHAWGKHAGEFGVAVLLRSSAYWWILF